MLTMLCHRVGKELSLSEFIAMPTIANLAVQMDMNKNTHFTQLQDQLNKDVQLDPAIVPLSKPNPFMQKPKVIFLTGATGFVGSHLLNDLLLQTDATIYCLVRASNPEEALNLLVQKLIKYKLPACSNSSKIVPILGNLNQDKLGLSSDDYDLLIHNVDKIYHVGAWVHHIYDYNTLYKTNVHSVEEILKMAVSIKNKSVHFISTLGTTLISPISHLGGMNTVFNQSHLNLNGYLCSKWVAEQILLAASSRGIQVCVYRPGNVIGGKEGVYEAQSNHILLRLKGMLQLGKGFIAMDEQVEMMPVDLLCSSIVELSNNPQRFSYNLNNVETLSWIEYLNIAKKKGYSFDLIPEKETWNQMMNELKEDNALYTFAHLYKNNVDAPSKNHSRSNPDVVITTPCYLEMVERQLEALAESGFLARPSCQATECS